MSVSQISVFVESQPGHLARILGAFEQAGINVRGYSASDTEDFGIARFILDDPQKALATLSEMGSAVTTTDVVCIKLDDRPGELARVMKVIGDAGINIGYSYSMISTYIILKVDDIASAEKALATEPISLVSQAEITGLH